MTAKTIGRVVGVASLTAGITDMVLGPTFGRGIGAGEKMGGRLFRVAAAREIATGVAGLIAPASSAPVRWRVAGDLFDLAALAYIAAPSNPRRKRTWLAFGIVAGVALADILALRRMQRSSPVE